MSTHTEQKTPCMRVCVYCDIGRVPDLNVGLCGETEKPIETHDVQFSARSGIVEKLVLHVAGCLGDGELDRLHRCRHPIRQYVNGEVPIRRRSDFASEVGLRKKVPDCHVCTSEWRTRVSENWMVEQTRARGRALPQAPIYDR